MNDVSKMQKFTVKVNDLGMIDLPKEICKALKLEERSLVYISVERKRIVLRNTDIGKRNAIKRTVDEFSRVVLPYRIRQYLHTKTNDTISFELNGDTVILTRGKVAFMPDKKELLDMNNEQELEKMRERRHSGTILTAMEDFYSIILFSDYNEADIQKLFDTKNLLEELAVLWQDDKRVMELQETLLREFLVTYK